MEGKEKWEGLVILDHSIFSQVEEIEPELGGNKMPSSTVCEGSTSVSELPPMCSPCSFDLHLMGEKNILLKSLKKMFYS